MQSPETAMDNIRQALDNDLLSLDQLNDLTHYVANARRDTVLAPGGFLDEMMDERDKREAEEDEQSDCVLVLVG